MNRLVLFLVGSLALNAALLVTLKLKPALAPPALREYLAPSAPTRSAAPATAATSTPAPEANGAAAVAAETRARLWGALDTEDLPALVARLRAAGFSPAVIRALVSAKVEARFSARMAALVGKPEDTPYWKAERSAVNDAKYWEERSQLYRERTRVLREVLGDDFFAYGGTDPAAAQRRQFGDIPKWKTDLIQRINDDYAEMSGHVRMAMQGVTLPEDRDKLALLERERRADLAALLTAEELEAYDLRSSQVATRLRTPMGVMDATEAEYRAIYRVMQQFDERVNPREIGVISPETSRQMTDFRKQMNDEIRAALGPARYADYQRASDREFQQLYQIAQREQIGADTTIRGYNLREVYAARSTAIMTDSAMTPEEKRLGLQTLAQNARVELIGVLGQNAGSAYAQNSRWVRQIESGGSFSINEGNLSFRSLPLPRK